MKTIYKYTIPTDNRVSMIWIPEGARILSAQNQKEEICIWALVDDKAEFELRTFRIAPTGLEIPNPEDWTFVDTVQLDGGSFVAHIFVKSC